MRYSMQGAYWRVESDDADCSSRYTPSCVADMCAPVRRQPPCMMACEQTFDRTTSSSCRSSSAWSGSFTAYHVCFCCSAESDLGYLQTRCCTWSSSACTSQQSPGLGPCGFCEGTADCLVLSRASLLAMQHARHGQCAQPKTRIQARAHVKASFNASSVATSAPLGRLLVPALAIEYTEIDTIVLITATL